MMQPWIGERMTEEHRRDLTAISAWAGRTPLSPTPAPEGGRSPLAASGTEAGVHGWHHPFGQHLGALLIRAGTRLGGATITTS
jgi:hypothetical protein